jgi:hypothetical protein
MAEMTSRERVLAALNHQEPDRVPFDLGGSGYDTLMVTAAKDADQVVATLSTGQWSEWIFDTFTVGNETRTGSFKFRMWPKTPGMLPT